MRKFLIPAVAALAVAAVEVAPTIAQDQGGSTVSTKTSVSPNKAGTKKKPQGVKLNFQSTFTTPGDVEHPIVTGGTVYITKGALYNGGKFTSCSVATLSHGGPSKCPTKSIMGSGGGTAHADQTITKPKITVVNGGAHLIHFWTVLQNPARVAASVEAKITKQTGKWAYKVTFQVPKSLQIVAGIPITLDKLNVTLGGRSYAKDWLATTSCPANHKWPYESTFTLSAGSPISYNGSVACK
ncbi:MAG: hypothetical protein JWQ18_1777 [Conexibacter sp.]|nr:hypothetical protein [Conexibacter sp.]